MNLPVMEPFEQLDESFALSVRFGISLYEASYVSAADARGYALVTADHRLFEAVHGELPFVKLPGNVEL